MNTNKEVSLYNAVAARIKHLCNSEQNSQFWVFYNRNPPKDISFRSIAKLMLSAAEYSGIDEKIIQEAIDDVAIAFKEEKQQEKEEKKKVKQEKEKREENIIETPFMVNCTQIYEQIKGNKFITHDGTDYKYLDSFEIDGIKYVPRMGEEITREIVILPTLPQEYGFVTDLLKEIQEFIHIYLDVESEHEHFAAWYVMLTWVYDKMPTINYLSAMGDTGTGKSRYLDVIGRICYRPIIGSGGVSVAAVKRIIDKWKGTLIIDEGDIKDSDESNEMIKIFNLGFEKNKALFNCDKNDPSKIEFFDPFCPKVISRRRQFQDAALEARCLTHTMRQTNRKDIKELLGQKFYDKQVELRNKLLKFRFDYYWKIDVDKAMEVDLGDVEPRIKQATRCFVTLFANIPETLDQFRAIIKQFNDNVIDERAATYDGEIIQVVVDLIIEGKTDIISQDIAERMNVGKSYEKSIGKHLAQLGLKTHVRKVNGKAKRIVPIEKVPEIAKRYINDQEMLVTLVTFVTRHMVDPYHVTENQQQLIKKNQTCTIADVTNVTDVTTEDIIEENVGSNDKKYKKTQSEVVINLCKENPQGWVVTEEFENVVVSMKEMGIVFEISPGIIKLLE